MSPGNPSLSGVPLLGQAMAFVPGMGIAWEQGRRPRQLSHPDLTARTGGLQVTSAVTVLKATLRG